MQSELDSIKYDWEKEKQTVIELSDKLDAKEVSIEKLEASVNQLNLNINSEKVAKSRLEADIEGKPKKFWLQKMLIHSFLDLKGSLSKAETENNTLKSDKDDLQVEVQSLKDKLHQFKKKSVENEMDMQKTNESITLIEDKTKSLEEKVRASESASEEWQDKFKEAQETIYNVS